MKLTQEKVEVIHNIMGTAVYDSAGERIGFVAGIFSVSEDEEAEYIILGSECLTESSTKFFAVPAYKELIDVSASDSAVTARFSKDYLRRAKRISVARCPRPFEYDPLIYELSDFPVSKNENTSCSI